VQHLTDCAMRFAEMSHGEAFTHHRHGGFRLELFGRDQPACDGLQLEDVREAGICAVCRRELAPTPDLASNAEALQCAASVALALASHSRSQ
jgi:hypothetical protein